MQDRTPTPGQEGRVLITPEDGSAPFYATVEMADNPSQEGTPLDKATLLKDATAALYGLGTDAVPDDVLAEIKALITLTQETADAKGTVASGSYIGTGTSGSSSPNTLQFPKPPKFVVVTPNNMGAGTNMSLFLVRESQLPSMTNSTAYAQLSSFWSGNSVSWYNRNTSKGAEYQLNINGTTYYYVGLY